MDSFVTPAAAASDHELRAQLRKARIDIKILERQLAAARACLAGHHTVVRGDTCIICQKALAHI